MTVTESWAGVGAPRAGWEAVGTLQDSALRQSAEAGITEIAAIIPDKPGALIVNNARATVWGRELPGAAGLPLGAAFAALTLGFLADGEQQLFRAGTLVPAQRSPRARPGPHRFRTQASAVGTCGAAPREALAVQYPAGYP